MTIEAIGLAFVGMVVVFIFIFIMVAATSLLRGLSAQPKPCPEPQSGRIQSQIIPAISAAIRAHRRNRERRDAR